MDNSKKISFRQKVMTICPVCSFEFHKEEMMTGGGRLIAGKLSDELRRYYEESKKYGRINPLVYQLTICPSCYYTSFPKDFDALLSDEIDKMNELTANRKNAIIKFFGNINFDADKTLIHGAASYMLAVDSYSLRNKKVAPTFKMAVCAIRAAWLFTDLSQMYPQQQYKKISQFFYKKAYQYYVKVLELVQSGDEPADAAGNMGPDTDKNWGYDGILYMTAILTLKVGSQDKDIKKRIDNFEQCKRYLSRLFGIGKTSKTKPSELLDKTRDLYDRINEKLEEWNQQLKNAE